MARTGTGTLLRRRNIQLESFLKRSTGRALYERIRTSEPCVVVSDSVRRVYMHVVLCDERVYLTEYAPRTLTAVVSFRRVRDIELVNDLPDFLRGKDRQLCQHIRITYVNEKPAGKGHDWLRDRWEGLPPAAPPSHQTSHCPTGTRPVEGCPTQRAADNVPSASCLTPETPPHPPSSATPLLPSMPPRPPSDPRTHVPEPGQVAGRVGSVLARVLRRGRVSVREEKEAELHLYTVSPSSRLYFHLQSSWNSFMIRSTLLLDPLSRLKLSPSPDSSPANRRPAVRLGCLCVCVCVCVCSWERTVLLHGQLTCELLQAGTSVEHLYLPLQELQGAAQRSVALRRLFWRSGEVCAFLVQSLEGSQGLSGLDSEDLLLLNTLTVQTLAVMFRETEMEPSRLGLLSANKGALASRMLLALMCDPQRLSQTPGTARELLLSEYLDASCWLLAELLLVGQEASTTSRVGNFLSVGWILRVLQAHPHLLPFMSFQAQQVVLVLSDLQGSVLSPAQSVLLCQRCHLLLACLQHNSQLARDLQSHFREEFRYFVQCSSVEEKLPAQYPISQPTRRLVQQIRTRILHTDTAPH
ncbi:uncharacterized protein C12orf56 homolog [Aulostomus maculatus]